jgi:hypothetical protein
MEEKIFSNVGIFTVTEEDIKLRAYYLSLQYPDRTAEYNWQQAEWELMHGLI